MKTNVFKIVLPMAVVALALAGAVNTSAMEKNGEIFDQMGYAHISSPESCDAVQECSNVGNYNCTVPDPDTAADIQLFAKPLSTCLTPLKRENP